MSHRPTSPFTYAGHTSILSAFLYGVGGGLIGAAVISISEKVEQNIYRPSLVPGDTLLRLLGQPAIPGRDMTQVNLVAHYSSGAIAGAAKGLMAWYGLRGPFSNFMFMGICVAIDQTLENWAGVGVSPWLWPFEEQVVDLAHKAIYAFVTGYLADQWIV